MTAAKVVTLGQQSDVHYRYAVETLGRMSGDIVMLDVDAPTDFSLEFARDGDIQVRAAGVPVELSQFWYRLKFPLSPMRPHFAPGLEEVVRMEWTAFATGLAHLYPDRCLTGPKMARPHNKLAQLQAAAKVGFQIPQTMVGLGKPDAESFAERHPQMIFKALHASRLGHVDEPVFDILATTAIDAVMLRSLDDGEFRACPYLLQERLNNSSEHRLIAFGDELFCYRAVDVPGVKPMQDRRLMVPDFELVEPPSPLRDLVQAYFSEIGLNYGVFDVLIPDGGPIVFFECNPDGQWHSANGLNVETLLDRFALSLLSRGRLGASTVTQQSRPPGLA